MGCPAIAAHYDRGLLPRSASTSAAGRWPGRRSTMTIAMLEGWALGEQRNGEWRYLEFLQVTSLITADIFMREIPGGTRARHRSRPVDLPEHRY